MQNRGDISEQAGQSVPGTPAEVAAGEAAIAAADNLFETFACGDARIQCIDVGLGFGIGVGSGTAGHWQQCVDQMVFLGGQLPAFLRLEEIVDFLLGDLYPLVHVTRLNPLNDQLSTHIFAHRLI